MLRRLQLPTALLAATLLLASSTSAAWAADNDYAFGATLQHKNLTIVPLHLKGAAQPGGEFLTFEEAAKLKLIKVTELDGNTSTARVNAVHVSSTAKIPVYIMSGEVILGGKQDRIISENTVIPPNAQKLSVKVFCVEQGRWNGRKAEFRATGKLSHSKLRSTAQLSKNQERVWNEVANANKKHAAKTSTGTYRATLNKVTDKVLKPYLKATLPALRNDTKAVGIAVAIDGQVIALDAFANPKLFGKIRDKLVASYAVEAIGSNAPKADKVDTKAVQVFLAKINKAEAKAKDKARKRSSGDADNYAFDDDEIVGNLTESKPKKGKKRRKAVMHKFYRVKSKDDVVMAEPPSQRRNRRNNKKRKPKIKRGKRAKHRIHKLPTFEN